MDFILESLGTYFVPIGARNPAFGKTVGLGPDFSEDAFRIALSRPNSNIRAAIVKDQKLIDLKRPFNPSVIDEEIYFCFSEKDRWIVIWENETNMGIIFSAESPNKILGDNFDFMKADNDFYKECEDRIKKFHVYYNLETSMSWLRLRNWR